MRNFLRAALIIGTLSTPAIVLADTPAKDAPAKTTEKPAETKVAPKTTAKVKTKTTAKTKTTTKAKTAPKSGAKAEDKATEETK